jgi:hypothetical protein
VKETFIDTFRSASIRDYLSATDVSPLIKTHDPIFHIELRIASEILQIRSDAVLVEN